MDEPSRQEPVAAVVLAAGLSTRMARFKPLLDYRGATLVEAVVRQARDAGGVRPIIVVTGHRGEDVGAALRYHPVTIVHNSDFQSGAMLSSVQVGVRAIPFGTAAFFVMQADHPAVEPATLRSLVAVWRRSQAEVVVPVFEGKRGHPVLFDARCAVEILALSSRQTLRDFVHKVGPVEAPVDDAGILTDVDTPEQYEALGERDVKR